MEFAFSVLVLQLLCTLCEKYNATIKSFVKFWSRKRCKKRQQQGQYRKKIRAQRLEEDMSTFFFLLRIYLLVLYACISAML